MRLAGPLYLAILLLAACEAEKRALPAPGPGAQEVTFESDPPGAQIAIEGEPAGQAPLKIKLDPGRYRVRVSMSAYFPKEEVLTVPYGQPASYKFSLIRSH